MIPVNTYPRNFTQASLLADLFLNAGLPINTISTRDGTPSYDVHPSWSQAQIDLAASVWSGYAAKAAKVTTFNNAMAVGITVTINGSPTILPADERMQGVYGQILNNAQGKEIANQPLLQVLTLGLFIQRASQNKTWYIPLDGTRADIAVVGNIATITALTSYKEQIDTLWVTARS